MRLYEHQYRADHTNKVGTTVSGNGLTPTIASLPEGSMIRRLDGTGKYGSMTKTKDGRWVSVVGSKPDSVLGHAIWLIERVGYST